MIDEELPDVVGATSGCTGALQGAQGIGHGG